ncbi:hypothetical protein H5981_04370 [Megamonas funiformis]|nr:hypothetical protein [Megamonas funiformis]
MHDFGINMEKLNLMKEFLSVQGRKLLIQISICTIIIIGMFINYDKLYLITGVFTGYLLAVICAWVMVYRTWKAAHLTVGKAKGQMWLSLITRLLMIFIILRAAILQSVELFYAVVGGFFLAFILYMIHLIIFVYYKNME